MADRNRDREPRWNNTGYWTDQPEEENWEGDRSLSRNYNRDDQRRYGQKSQDQAERMRQLRGEGNDEKGHSGPQEYNSGPQDDRRGQSSGQASRWQAERWDERERYRGYGTDIARSPNRARGANRSGRDWGWSGRQDDDRDYRTYNRGQDLNMEGNPAWERDENFSPGFRDADYGGEYRRAEHRYEDPGDTNESGPNRVDTGRFTERDRRGDFDQHLDFDWEVEQGYRTSMDREWTASDEDLTGNYWGARERDRRSRESGFERDRQRDRGGFVSGRNTNRGRGDFYEQVEDEREFDMDPGFAYEFGTDFDFMRDTDRRSSREDFYRQRSQNRGETRHQEQRSGAPISRTGQHSRADEGRIQDFWRTEGPYSGMGPSGYQRSDERIMEDVCERLTQHGRIDSRQIEIQVRQGEVTLSGQVRRKDEKHLAEDVADGVTGVKHVNNRLRVA